MKRAGVVVMILGICLAFAAPAWATQERGMRAIATVRREFHDRFGGSWLVGERGIGVRIVGLTDADVALVHQIAGGLEAEVLPATYTRRELIAFMRTVDRHADEPVLAGLTGWGPQDTLGKLGITIDSPGVNTVQKLYSLFPSDAIVVRYQPGMMHIGPEPSAIDRALRSASVMAVLLGIAFVASRLGRAQTALAT